MKKVIKDNELYQIMMEALSLICDTVSSTLGPSGNNVIIDAPDTSPFITNDGVTIAKAIESDNQEVNTILEIVKEAALKTNELVGDGTTTTLVLLKEIFETGLIKIKEGKDPIILKKELNDSSKQVLEELDKLKQKPTKKDLISISTTSCGNKELSILLNEVYQKVNNKYSIKIEESNKDETYYEIKKGYSLNVDISNLYFQKEKEIIINNIYVLLLKGYLSSLEQISEIINDIIMHQKNILILVDDYDENIFNEIMLLYLKHQKNIFIFKMPDFTSRKNSIYEDLKTVTSSNIIDINYEEVCFSDLGLIKSLTIKKDEIILFNENDNIDKYINKLHNELSDCDNDYDKEFIENRLSKLEHGLATIYVSSPTRTETKEKILRLEDGLHSASLASSGITPGEGLAFLRIRENIENKIIKKALLAPFNKIMENSGLDHEKILKKIKESNYQLIYNIETSNYENINNTSILDSVEVIKMAIKNAISIAAMLLTTKSLVINENTNLKTEKTNNYYDQDVI